MRSSGNLAAFVVVIVILVGMVFADSLVVEPMLVRVP